MIYDFVGYDAMSRNPIDHAMAYLGNWGWAGGRKQKPSPADLTLFVGEPEDVDDRRFGLGLPNRRAFALRNCEFVGYVFPFDPGAYANPAEVRASLGYDDRPLIVCSIGGTAVGGDLLRLCAESYPHVAARLDHPRMVLVSARASIPTPLTCPPASKFAPTSTNCTSTWLPATWPSSRRAERQHSSRPPFVAPSSTSHWRTTSSRTSSSRSVWHVIELEWGCATRRQARSASRTSSSSWLDPM